MSTPAHDRTVLDVKELAFAAGGVRVLDGVSFALARGELAVVMGASGSGKTTLLKCLNRLLEPESGRITLNGVDTSALSPVDVRRSIGMVWQTPFMFDETVRENLRRAGEYSQSGVHEQAYSRLLDRVAFDGDPDADARKLSVGQQQRVSIARALVCQPLVLLCDEPTASLDHENALRLEATFRELCANGMSVVFVTHDAGQADRIADRTLVLADGTLSESTPA